MKIPLAAEENPQPETSGDPSLREIDDVAASTGADLLRGLSSGEAARRLGAQGPNTLNAAPPVSPWRRFLSQLQDPLIYLLLAAIAISLAAWAVDGRDGWPIDALVIAVVVLLNAALGYVQQAKARGAVQALTSITQATASLMRDGRVQKIPLASLVRGDLLVLNEGDVVGADARLVAAADLRVHEASLTGESVAVLKSTASLHAPAALGDRVNMVFRGTAVTQGTGRAVVTATGMNTEMGAIAAMLEATREAPTPLTREVSRLGRVLGIAVLIIASVVVATILLLSELHTAGDVIAVMLLGVALAVAAVPEGLPAILSVVLAMGVQRMARHKAIIKNLSSVETLGCASVICTDKTGTLTRAEMTLTRIATASGMVDVTGAGYVPEGRLEQAGGELAAGPLREEAAFALLGGSLAGNAGLRQDSAGIWRIQGDATEAAFLVAARKPGPSLQARAGRYERTREIPFTSDRKMMSVIVRDHDRGGAAMLISKGAPDVLIERCTHVKVGAATVTMDACLKAALLRDVDALSDAALRTLAVAWRSLGAGEDPASASLEENLVYVGTAGLMDPPREEAAVAIRQAQRAGIRVIMITGDHPRTALRIAADLGICDAQSPALTGIDMDRLEEAEFGAAVRKTSVYARVAPAHKLRIVDALQADGQVVAMTGDGVNDAPALKSADIGIAMGLTGTEVTRQAARMILADDNFATIVEAVREGRGIFDNIRKFLRYLLSSNMGEVLTVFLGVVGAGVIGLQAPGVAVVLPLLATQILWLNLITDSWPALAMGIDPAVGDVMARKPRARDARVIDARMWSGILQTGAVIAVATLLTMDMLLPGGLIEGSQDLAVARTAGFTVLVLAHLFNAFNARSETATAFHRLFSNPWLWAALGLSLGLQIAVVNLGFLNYAFGTAPLTLEQWLLCAAMASTVLWHAELRKLAGRAWRRHARTRTAAPGGPP